MSSADAGAAYRGGQPDHAPLPAPVRFCVRRLPDRLIIVQGSLAYQARRGRRAGPPLQAGRSTAPHGARRQPLKLLPPGERPLSSSKSSLRALISLQRRQQG